jgi:hypothetical protein
MVIRNFSGILDAGDSSMEATEKKKAAPPYVAYKTLKNFLEKFKQGIPARIDRGLMGTMSGAAQSQVTTAMRYLGMISDNGLPTKALHEYASGDEHKRKEALFGMLMSSYPFIFDDPETFSMKTATALQLREAFEANTTATGETLGRCIAFLKEAALDAGIQVSPYILQKKGRTPSARKKSTAQRKEEKSGENVASSVAHVPAPQLIPAQTSLLLSGLFQRLPKPGTKWQKEERERWVQTLQNVLLLEYPEA